MSPVPPTDEETAARVEEGNVKAPAEDVPSAPASAPAAAAGESTEGAPTTPAPTKVDAYKHRGIRGTNHSPLDIAPVFLRLVTAIFSLIAFAVIASDSSTISALSSSGTSFIFAKVHFKDFFYFSYLLTVNVITFVYAIATILLSVALLTRRSVSHTVFIIVFALDQILSYLLLSASTSAATGIRIQKYDLDSLNVSSSFLSKAYAAIAFSFLAFFVLAAAALLSALRAIRRS